MRQKALERAKVRWQEEAVEQLPSTYPDNFERVVRSPLIPALMPGRIRFVRVDDAAGARPVSRPLEAALGEWLYRVRMADIPDSHSALAAAMAKEAGTDKKLVLALVGGSGEHQFTRYEGWRPDHTWGGLAQWEARLDLIGETAEEYSRILDDLAEWMCVPEPRSDHRSVLVACPERDILSGTWWKYATGEKGAPMPVLGIGATPFADEIFWTIGADKARAPTLRELHAVESHFFAIEDGPAGYVSFANPRGVGWGSGHLDRVDAAALSRLRETLAAEDDADVDEVFDRLEVLVPRTREFYDRAYHAGHWIAHFGFVDELEQLATEYVVEAGSGSTIDSAL